MGRRRRSEPRFDVALAAAAAPRARTRGAWLAVDPCEVAAAVLEHHPDPAAITQAEVHALVDAIARDHETEHGSHAVKVGGAEVVCRARETRIDKTSIYHSPRLPTLSTTPPAPMPGSAGALRIMLEQALDRQSYDGADIVDVRAGGDRRSWNYDVLEVVMERPEGGGRYETFISFEHLPDHARRANVERAAMQIAARHRHRHHVAGLVHGARLWAAEKAARVDGIDLVDVKAGYIHFDPKPTSSHVLCTFSHIGDTLRRVTSNVAAHNDDQFAVVANRHRKGSRAIAEGEERTVHPIVAAAVRAAMGQYGRGILEEVEATMEGGGARPSNPVKRRIANFSMRHGELRAPVTLARGVRLHKERVNVKSVKQLPDAMLRSMVGKPMRSVVDHPFLADVEIASATINSTGLHLRPRYTPIPLATLLDELRAAVAAMEDKA